MTPTESPQTVAIAGASGFVGRPLAQTLADAGHRVITISRGANPPVEREGIEHRPADLFSLLDCGRALEGCEVAVYLVHSMMPSARLTQAGFEDMDLILADNFARAAASAGVKRIIYLGGLIPEARPLSPHLASRQEVEDALAGHGVPVTTLRAGLVIGSEGPSFRIVERLVARLPAMVLPGWTRTPTQPIAHADIVELLARCVGDPGVAAGAHDVGGPEVVTYRHILERTAVALERRPPMIPVPFFSPQLSRLWVTLVTGTPKALISPLLESLKSPMVAANRALQTRLDVPGLSLDESIARALAPRKSRRRTERRARRQAIKAASTVRSVQRLPMPTGWTASDVAQAYMKWLPRALWPLIGVGVDGERIEFRIRGVRVPLLVLRFAADRSTDDRPLFYIVGGWLARLDGSRPGRLEFRSAVGGRVALAAIHDFRPRLPWFLYNLTQARFHLWVMRRFGRFLGRVAPDDAAPPASGALGHDGPTPSETTGAAGSS